MRKSAQGNPFEEKQTDANIEQAIEGIIKKQEVRKAEAARYVEAKKTFNLTDNIETHKLLKGLEGLTSLSFGLSTKVSRLRKLNERGNRQIQAMHAADGDKLADSAQTGFQSISVPTPATAQTSVGATSLERSIGMSATKHPDHPLSDSGLSSYS